ncbi:MAG: HAD family hydrolase [Ignavibacteria bacterium]|nr:HAD family hydrolase [Ignavibacteria bacterium]
MSVTEPTPLRNVIFDIDGTILDSHRDIVDAQIWTLRQFGVDGIADEQMRRHIGKPIAEIFASLLPPSLHNEIPRASIVYRDRYRAHMLKHTKLFPGVESTLSTLSRRGVGLAIATTKSTETSSKLLSHFGIASLFQLVQGSDSPPYKPDPAIIHTILDTLKWNARETLMVGDSANDILAGKSAGTLTCGVTYGSLGRDEMKSLNPDCVIDSISELTSLF